MPIVFKNPHRGQGLDIDAPLPCDDVSALHDLVVRCADHPAQKETPLLSNPRLAQVCGVSNVYLKDERGRYGLGSFKALGAAHAIAREAAQVVQGANWHEALIGHTYVSASAGNHGLSVTVGALLFGARAVIYLSHTVPESFAQRLRDKGAQVVRDGADYEASMASAASAADTNNWTLLSDSSWPGYMDLPYRVMEGYLQLAFEAASQIPEPPTHIFLQAGVGGMAAAVAAYARKTWGDDPQIIVVEPEAAPALMESIRAGAVCNTQGPVSAMGRLDCKTPSMIALRGLARDADLFATLTENEASTAVSALAQLGIKTTPSGAAGIAAVMAGLTLPPEAKVLAILSEGPEHA